VQNAEPFYTPESRPAKTPWRMPALLVCILLILALPMQDWGHAEVSGFYYGRIDNPSTGTLGLTVYLQQVGESVSGNLTLSSTYAYKQTEREAQIHGKVTASRFQVQGNLEGGGVIFLEGKSASSAKVFRLLGKAHFEDCNESREPAPFELKKIRRSQFP